MAMDDDDKRSMSPLMLDDSLSSSSDSPRFTPLRFTSRRRRVVVTTAAALSALSLLVLAYFSSSRPLLLVPQDPILPPKDSTPPWDRKSVLLGPPTDRFRGEPPENCTTLVVTSVLHLDNLRNDTKYITSWISAGWS
jgi:hypothetical protein